jgi:hypothetical protein
MTMSPTNKPRYVLHFSSSIRMSSCQSGHTTPRRRSEANLVAVLCELGLVLGIEKGSDGGGCPSPWLIRVSILGKEKGRGYLSWLRPFPREGSPTDSGQAAGPTSRACY